MEKAFNFIEKSVSKDAAEKKYEIDDNMYAVIETSLPKKPEEQKLEAHKKYIDLQYIIQGQDVMGWQYLADCKKLFLDYNETKDIEFYADDFKLKFMLRQGEFAVFFPKDAHAPLCGEAPVKKCIVKINAELIGL